MTLAGNVTELSSGVFRFTASTNDSNEFGSANTFAQFTAQLTAKTFLLHPGSYGWRYNDTGSDPGSGWLQPEFNDSAWPLGATEFGFGDGNEATLLNSNR